MRQRAAQDPAFEHPGQHDIARILGPPCHLVGAVHTGNVPADMLETGLRQSHLHMFLEIFEVFLVVNENTELSLCAAGPTGHCPLTDELGNRLGPIGDENFLTWKKSSNKLLQVSFRIRD